MTQRSGAALRDLLQPGDEAVSMRPRKPKSEPTWSDVEAKLVDFDRGGLLGLVQNLCAASKDNRDFLHADDMTR